METEIISRTHILLEWHGHGWDVMGVTKDQQWADEWLAEGGDRRVDTITSRRKVA